MGGVRRHTLRHARRSPGWPRRSSGCRGCAGCRSANVLALLAALDGPSLDGDTTNLVTADDDGNVCVLTTSLGLGTGDFLPGLDLHLNSMLGEVDLAARRSSRASGWRA